MDIDLTNYAASKDMGRARRHGTLLIGQTKEGTVRLDYADSVYTLTKQGLDARELAKGKAGAVRQVLATLYFVYVDGVAT